MTLLGYKVNTGFEVLVLLQRRFELTDNLSLLQRQLEDEGCERWINDVEHDGMAREMRLKDIGKDRPSGDPEARTVAGLIEQSLAIFDEFDQCPARVQDLGLANATTESAGVKLDPQSGRFLCRIEVIVPGTPGELATFLMDLNSRYQVSMITRGTARYLMTDVDSWHAVMFREERLTFPFTSRTFLCDVVCKKTSWVNEPAAYVVAMQPRQSHSLVSPEEEKHLIRGQMQSIFRLTVSDQPGCTTVDYACTIDLKPSWLIARRMLPVTAITRLLASSIQVYFQQIKKPEACTARDGALVGHMMIDVTRSKKSLLNALRTFVYRTAMLREVPLLTHFGTLVFVALTDLPAAQQNRLGNAAIRVARTMTEENARTIGAALAELRRMSPDPKFIVQQLVVRFKLVQKLSLKYVWFSPMLESITSRLDGCTVSNVEMRLMRAKSQAKSLARRSVIGFNQRATTFFDPQLMTGGKSILGGPVTPRTPRKPPPEPSEESGSDSEGDHYPTPADASLEGDHPGPVDAARDALLKAHLEQDMPIVEDDHDSFDSVVRSVACTLSKSLPCTLCLLP